MINSEFALRNSIDNRVHSLRQSESAWIREGGARVVALTVSLFAAVDAVAHTLSIPFHLVAAPLSSDGHLEKAQAHLCALSAAIYEFFLGSILSFFNPDRLGTSALVPPKSTLKDLVENKQFGDLQEHLHYHALNKRGGLNAEEYDQLINLALQHFRAECKEHPETLAYLELILRRGGENHLKERLKGFFNECIAEKKDDLSWCQALVDHFRAHIGLPLLGESIVRNLYRVLAKKAERELPSKLLYSDEETLCHLIDRSKGSKDPLLQSIHTRAEEQLKVLQTKGICPSFPHYYHCTRDESLLSIWQNNMLQMSAVDGDENQRAVFVSTRREHELYGPYCFAFDRRIEFYSHPLKPWQKRLSNYWAGLSKNLSLDNCPYMIVGDKSNDAEKVRSQLKENKFTSIKVLSYEEWKLERRLLKELTNHAKLIPYHW